MEFEVTRYKKGVMETKSVSGEGAGLWLGGEGDGGVNIETCEGRTTIQRDDLPKIIAIIPGTDKDPERLLGTENDWWEETVVLNSGGVAILIRGSKEARGLEAIVVRDVVS